jgi:hypothetical protein
MTQPFLVMIAGAAAISALFISAVGGAIVGGGAYVALAADSDVMEKKPEPTKPVLWDILISIAETKEGHVGMLLGTVEAADTKEAIEKAAEKFKRRGGNYWRCRTMTTVHSCIVRHARR